MKSVTEILQTKYPLIQAPTSWLTNATLVSAVGNAGGLGVLGPNAGQTTVTADPVETAERMRREIHQIRSLTDRPFGLNVFPPSPGKRVRDNAFTAELLKMAYEEKVTHFVVVGTPHEELFDDIKAHDATLVFRPLTPSIEQMQEAERLGADLLVATGSEEGGILPRQDYGTFTVVPAMVDAVSLPMLAAGGINDARGVKAAFSFGAQGVYVGSRFLVTQESPMADAAKQAALRATFADVRRISASQRSLSTPAADKYAERYAATHDAGLDHEISVDGGLRAGMLLGDLEHGIISVNNGVDAITTIPTVEQLVTSLMSGQVNA